MKIGVVIPFYQRETGILARALKSIAAQSLPPDTQVEVIVVDDASPVPAAQEMAGRQDAGTLVWRSVRQANAGPGGARNTGMDVIAEQGGFDYIAFLDSDDEWHPDHLSRAVSALEQGYDFYFSDNRRDGEFDSYFDLIDIRAVVTDPVWRATAPLGDDIVGFAPHSLDHAVLREYLSQSSTVVLRQSTMGAMRFDPELRHASEDRMMWIQLALSGARIAISTRREVECGRGINMFYESIDWQSPDIVPRLGSQLLFGQKLMALPLGGIADETRRDMDEKRRLYAYLSIRNLLKGSPSPRRTLRLLMKRDPTLPLRMPFLFAAFALSRRRE